MEDNKKKYEQALERAKTLHKLAVETSHENTRMAIEELFPELRESEDEKIRKALKEAVCYYWNDDTQAKLDCLAWLKKQGEQKPVDKVEPKFKVGDWIINSEGMLRHILAVDKTGYQTDYGWLTHDIYDNTYHLWTIQDAKDGDVLSFGDDTIIIFKNLYNNSSFHAYCYIERGVFGINTKLSWWSSNGFVPATQEQHDLLFQKMKEAGYEWDAEKKELKKIEQKAALSKENSCYYDDICEILINLINSPKSNVNKDVVQKDLDWLRSVKKSQLKSTWSEEDENGLGDALWAVKQARTIAKDENEMGGLWYAEKWLKSLKERIGE